jgi:xanthine dehydrogenase accessory factor
VGQTVAIVDGQDVKAEIGGVLRGIMRDGSMVRKNLKLGDIDPRDEKVRSFTIAERSAIIGEGVLEAIRVLSARERTQIPQNSN